MEKKTSEIAAVVKELLCQELNFEPPEITETTNIRELPDIESIKILRVILSIEERYDVELEDQVVFSVNTIEDIARAVTNLLAQKT